MRSSGMGSRNFVSASTQQLDCPQQSPIEKLASVEAITRKKGLKNVE